MKEYQAVSSKHETSLNFSSVVDPSVSHLDVSYSNVFIKVAETTFWEIAATIDRIFLLYLAYR